MDVRIVFSVAGVLLFIAVFALGYLLSAARPNRERRIQETPRPATGVDWLGLIKSTEKVVKPLGDLIPRSPEEMSRQEQRFLQAGIRRRDAPYLFYGIKV